MQIKRSYDAAFKLKVAEEAEKFGNRATGRKYSIDERRVREWRQKKNDLEKLPSKKKGWKKKGVSLVYQTWKKNWLHG